MANDTVITVIGGLTADPELRFTPAGVGVANFTIASTPETFDRNSNEWKKGEPLYMRCSAWNKGPKTPMAENVAESLTKGIQVIAQGRLKSRSYETKEGEKRTVMELEVDSIGPTLLFNAVKVAQAGGNQQQTQQPAQQQPWGGNQPAQNPAACGNGTQAEAPF